MQRGQQYEKNSELISASRVAELIPTRRMRLGTPPYRRDGIKLFKL
jgi:hypothetical protein